MKTLLNIFADDHLFITFISSQKLVKRKIRFRIFFPWLKNIVTSEFERIYMASDTYTRICGYH